MRDGKGGKNFSNTHRGICGAASGKERGVLLHCSWGIDAPVCMSSSYLVKWDIRQCRDGPPWVLSKTILPLRGKNSVLWYLIYVQNAIKFTRVYLTTKIFPRGYTTIPIKQGREGSNSPLSNGIFYYIDTPTKIAIALLLTVLRTLSGLLKYFLAC